MQRLPTAQNFFHYIADEHSSLARFVIDVGAQYDSPFLRLPLSCSFHHLVEPLPRCHKSLIENYASVAHAIHPLAICGSSQSGKAYLVHYSNYGNVSQITHTQLVFSALADVEKLAAEQNNVCSFAEVETMTLDDLLTGLDLQSMSTVVKVDVDGLDFEILLDSSRLKELASFVMVESPIGRVHEFISMMIGKGFSLCEVVSPCYYKNRLAQVDLVFINSAIHHLYSSAKGVFDLSQWQNIDSIAGGVS